MTILSSLSDFLKARRRARQRHSTRVLVDALPPEIQKDIGWRSGAHWTDDAIVRHARRRRS